MWWGAGDSLYEEVRSDVEFLRNEPLIVRETKVSGWIYDHRSGAVRRVA